MMAGLHDQPSSLHDQPSQVNKYMSSSTEGSVGYRLQIEP